ncbi:MAG: sporulation protein YabP [Ruminococcaceae bacterium]|nr:sporulation protein YabP [Oscillospiraceae bacterium]
MPQDKLNQMISHHLILQNREKLSVSGVEDVENFDDREIVIVTSHGKLTVTGSGLHMGRLSLDEGELAIEGIVDTLEYSADHDRRGFLSRLFG